MGTTNSYRWASSSRSAGRPNRAAPGRKRSQGGRMQEAHQSLIRSDPAAAVPLDFPAKQSVHGRGRRNGRAGSTP